MSQHALTATAGTDLTASATIIALVTNPIGGGNHDLEVIRDGVFPPRGATDSSQEYDTYTGSSSRAEDWIGYEFAATQTFGSVVFEGGKQFYNGGWFTSLRLQAMQGGSWVDVPNATVTPAYGGNDGVNFETYSFNFPAISGTAIRLYGAPGGVSAFVSVGELRVYGPPPTSIPDGSGGTAGSTGGPGPALDSGAADPNDGGGSGGAAAGADLTPLASIVALITSPTGGGSRNLEVIRDGVFPPVGSTDSRQQYDTYNGMSNRLEDWIGYQFSSTQTLGSVVFQGGRQFYNGGWFTSFHVQVLQGMSWHDVPNVTATPSYAGNDGRDFETYTFTFPAVEGTGIRIYGTPGGVSSFISVGELRVYGASRGSGGSSGGSTPPAVKPPTTPPPAAGTPPVLKIGVWSNISPPLPFTNVAANLVMFQGKPGLLAAGIAVDPSNPLTVYECINSFAIPSDGGVWKTTDGGTSWTHSAQLDYPVEVVVDPHNPKHLYASDGVSGTTFGFWVSNDGGGTWSQPDGFVQAASLPNVRTSDAYSLSTDPTDFNHVLVGFHSAWAGTTSAGVFESTDGGASWTVHDPPPGSNGLGYYVEFLSNPKLGIGDRNTWLLGTQGSGYFKTTDGGHSWTQVSKFSMAHEGMHTYYASDGTLYVGAQGTPMRSTDNGSSWTQLNVTGGGNWVGYFTTVYGDGKTLYAQKNGFGQDGPSPYYTSSETDGVSWQPMAGGVQTFLSGPMQMAFDPVNRILYASMFEDGIWALKVQ